MVRHLTSTSQHPVGSPHVRGDGPDVVSAVRPSYAFSPRAWGWSVQIAWTTQAGGVLPTCVGMVRVLPAVPSRSRRSPHVRGDGPKEEWWVTDLALFSPRAWGWSDSRRTTPGTKRVLPTCVGMVRLCLHRSLSSVCSPHVRGDGPPNPEPIQSHNEFSPRAWGWSVTRIDYVALERVLPTCVGMVRSVVSPSVGWVSSPHVRGDGPASLANTLSACTFSPRAWGWSVQ